MARKERNNVDYFPHSVNHGKKMFYLRDKYGNDGYAVWFMLLEQLGRAEYHYLDLKNDVELMYLSSEFKVSENVLNEIISILAKFGEFNLSLWEEDKIVFNEKFIENISDAYKKRNNECVNINSLVGILEVKGRSLTPKSTPKPSKSKLTVPVKPQSIVKETKPKENKENNTKNDLIFKELFISESWIETVAMNSKLKFSPSQVKNFLKKYNTTINTQFDFKNNKSEYCSHFTRWLDKQEKPNSNNLNDKTVII